VNAAEQKRDARTFERFGVLARELPELVTRTPFNYFWNEEGIYQEPWYKEVVFDVSCHSVMLRPFSDEWFTLLERVEHGRA
jgi:hypothetical protein